MISCLMNLLMPLTIKGSGGCLWERLYLAIKNLGLEQHQSQVPTRASPAARRATPGKLLPASKPRVFPVKLEVNDVGQTCQVLGLTHSKGSTNTDSPFAARRPGFEIISSDCLMSLMGKLRPRGMEGPTKG